MNAGFGGLLVGVVPGVVTKNMRVGVATGVVAGAAMAASTFWYVQPLTLLWLKARGLTRFLYCPGRRARRPLSRSTPRLASRTERKRRSEEERPHHCDGALIQAAKQTEMKTQSCAV